MSLKAESSAGAMGGGHRRLVCDEVGGGRVSLAQQLGTPPVLHAMTTLHSDAFDNQQHCTFWMAMLQQHTIIEYSLSRST